METPDLLIIGAGPVGCVIANKAATELGWTCLLVDKRNHIGGNCHDPIHASGVRIHAYGPHYFRTNNQSLIDYLSQFTEWIPGNYFVKSEVNSKLYSFPINVNTLEQFFGRTFSATEAKSFLETIRENISEPTNSEEVVVSKIGRQLFEEFYLGYTLKQWGLHPRELSPSVCSRIPVRFSRDDRYVTEKYQVMPKDGFTNMFTRMILLPKIEVLLNVDFQDIREQLRPRYATIYTGPIDEYFHNCLGRLPWRSLDFQFKEFDQEFVQPNVQINYPNYYDYTRSVEIKHVTGQHCPNTVISYEYSQAQGEPFYPIPNSNNETLYQKYCELAMLETRARQVYFAGRLATYRYINTDTAIESALETFERLKVELLSISRKK